MSEGRSPDPALAALAAWLTSGELPRVASDAEALALVEKARRHGLAPLLHDALLAGGVDWPEAAGRALRDEHRRSLFRSVQQLETARRTLAVLVDAGLRALPLKGAALAERVYDSPEERPMADVDLLVLDEWGTARRALGAAGLREDAASHHAAVFRDARSQAVVELHCDVVSCPGLFPMDREALWARALAVSGQGWRTPSPEDLLVHLGLHASFQHGLAVSLVQLLDFRRVLERLRPDPERVLAVARECRAEGPLAAALAAAKHLVGARSPAALEASLAGGLPRALARSIARLTRGPLGLEEDGSPLALAAWRWRLAAGRRTELLRRTLLASDAGESPSALVRLGHVASRAARLARELALG